MFISSRLGPSVIAIMAIGLCFLLLSDSMFYPAITILLSLSPVIIYYGLTDPYFSCLIFYAFSVFRLHEVIPVLFPYKIPLISASFMILTFVIHIVLRNKTLYWQKEMRYFLIFFIFITLGVPISSNFAGSYDVWSQLFLKIGIIFFMITWSIHDKIAFKSIILLTISCGVFLSLITSYNKHFGINLIEGTRASVNATEGSVIGDPNDLALTLLFPFSFCLSVLITKLKSLALRISGLFSSLIVFNAIIATQSRGGLLGMAGVMGYFVTRRFKSKWLFIIISSGFVLFLFTFANIGTRQSGGAGQGFDESTMGRIHAWEAAINMAIHHPIWGVGLGRFSDNLFNYAIVWEKVNLAVHSSWFELLSEAGFVGLGLFISCVYQAMKLAHRNIDLIESSGTSPAQALNTELILARSLYAGLIGFCISSTFLTQGFAWPFYIFFALSISLSHNLSLTNKNAAAY